MFDVSLPWASFWYDAFNVLLFAGAFAVAVGTYGAIKMGAVKERFSDERISANEAETARAVADSDIAKIAAYEAALELEKERVERLKLAAKIAPRLLTQVQQNELTAKLEGLTKLKGQIIASPSTSEAEWFARILAAPLRAAGWEIEPVQGTPVATLLQPKGVIIGFTILNPPVATSAKKLAELLNELGIDATAVATHLNPPDTAKIIINEKP